MSSKESQKVLWLDYSEGLHRNPNFAGAFARYGYQVTVETNPKEFWWEMYIGNYKSYDAVVMEIMFPIDGLSFSKKERKMAYNGYEGGVVW